MRNKKRYAEGGLLDLGTPQTVPQPPSSSSSPNTYPFASTSSSGGSGSNANTTNVSVGQTPVSQDAPAYKRGGRVRGSGCETRGKTRGRFV
jgi:hypothetical protein